MSKRILLFIMAGLVLIPAILAGCQSSASASTATSENGNSIYGKVTAIDGDKITIALAESNGYGNGARGSARPSGQPGSNAQARPSGQPKASGGAYPSGGRGSNPALTGESKTFTVNSSTAITIGGLRQSSSGAAASLSDIQVESYITVTLSGDTAAAITIMQFGNRNGNPGSPEASSNPSASGTEAASPAVPAKTSPGATPKPSVSTTPSIGAQVSF
jgi:hypothetical protein